MAFGGGFWATLDLLTDVEARGRPFQDDLKVSLENASHKVKRPMEDAKQDEVKKRGSIEEDSMDYGNLVQCSFSYPPVKTRLEVLMGTNAVRLTDRKYMLKLVSRIREDHEQQQMKRVQERKNQEILRTKELILNRLIPVEDAPPELRKYPLFQLYMYCDAVIEERQRRLLPKKVGISESLYSLLYPRREKKPVTDDEDQDTFMKRISIDELTHLIPMTEEEIADMMKSTDTEEDIDHGYMLTKEEYDALRYEADIVKKFKQSQTVADMYKKAHKIVGVLYSFSDARRLQRLKDKDKDKDKDEDAASSDVTADQSEEDLKNEPDNE